MKIRDFVNNGQLSKPRWLVSYILIVLLLYAVLYSVFENSLSVSDIGLVGGLYLSVEVLTTLGFGDITPVNTLGQILVSSEAVLGVIAVGLFLNSVAINISELAQKNQEEVIRRSDTSRLKAYYRVLHTKIFRYQHACYELSTPMDKRADDGSFNPDFLLNDLCDFRIQSMLLTEDLSKSCLHAYYDRQDSLVSEMKFLIANINLSRHKELENLFVAFIEAIENHDSRAFLLGQFNITLGDKRAVEEYSKMLKGFKGGPVNASTIFVPFAILQAQIKETYKITTQIEKYFIDLKIENS